MRTPYGLPLRYLRPLRPVKRTLREFEAEFGRRAIWRELAASALAAIALPVILLLALVEAGAVK